MKSRLAIVGAGLLIAEATLILISWILSATMTGHVRSLLSGEGVRWFFGSFTDVVASPVLVWLVLLLIAVGCMRNSGILRRQPSYRDRMALRVAAVFLAIYIVIILLLTAMPHAVLLSSTGSLFASPFSRSLVAVIAFGLVLVSVTFGLMSGRLQTLADILESLSVGIRLGAPLFILYIMVVQFVESLRFVFWL